MEALFGESKLEEGEKLSPNATNKGIFTGIYDNLIDGMKSVINKSGPGDDADLFREVKSTMLLDFVKEKSNISDIQRNVTDMDKRIADLNVMLARKEDAYYAKFTAMEKYMYEMNSQSSWLMQQMM